MKRLISYAAVGLVGLIASPFALGVLLLLLLALAGVVGLVFGLIAVVVAWAIPLAIAAGISVLAFMLITSLLDS